MSQPILVTGATGNAGREVVRALLARGLAARAAVRSPEKAQASLPASAELVPFDFERPETFAPALKGAAGLFLLRPPAISQVERTLNALVDEAARAGVGHAVFLSVAGAEKNRLVPHHAVERHLERSGMAWTFLRAGFFAQNLGDQYREDIVRDGRLYVPAGGGKVAFVDVRDLAELAAKAFGDPSCRRAAWTLTGPETFTFRQAAAELSQVLGRPIRYEPASVVGYLRHLRAQGTPWAQAGVYLALHLGLRFGNAEAIDPSLERLLGRRPRSLRDYVRDHAALWRPAGGP